MYKNLASYISKATWVYFLLFFIQTQLLYIQAYHGKIYPCGYYFTFFLWKFPLSNIYSVKKVPGIGHSIRPLKKIVENLFDAKLALLSFILTCSSSATCHLVFSQCWMLSVYLKCLSRFFQWIRISNKEFVSNFALQMIFRVRNRWKCYRRLTVNRLYQKTSLNWMKWWLKIVI